MQAREVRIILQILDPEGTEVRRGRRLRRRSYLQRTKLHLALKTHTKLNDLGFFSVGVLMVSLEW